MNHRYQAAMSALLLIPIALSSCSLSRSTESKSATETRSGTGSTFASNGNINFSAVQEIIIELRPGNFTSFALEIPPEYQSAYKINLAIDHTSKVITHSGSYRYGVNKPPVPINSDASAGYETVANIFRDRLLCVVPGSEPKYCVGPAIPSATIKGVSGESTILQLYDINHHCAEPGDTVPCDSNQLSEFGNLTDLYTRDLNKQFEEN